jgi:hypothetical protein
MAATQTVNPVVIGEDLKFLDLKHFVDNYLMKTEPNNYIDKSKPNLVIKHDASNNKITITEKPTRPTTEYAITKQLNTTLDLNNFEISISNLNDPNSNKEVLVFGNYKDTSIEKTCKTINDILVSDINTEAESHSNLIMDYLISYNNKGTEFDIFPLSLYKYIGSNDTLELKNNKKIVIDNIKNLLKFFIEKHNKYLKLETDNLKNMMFIYKLTSPYTSTYPLNIMMSKLGEPIEKKIIGMQAEGAHLDSCNLGDDNFVDDEYCELSSIIYTNVKNTTTVGNDITDKIPKQNYYASAAFFYAPEIPMPVRAELTSEMGIRGSGILQQFQQEYKRLFVSAPMTSTGWAIWKNKPKRNIKNDSGNRFKLTRPNGFNKKSEPQTKKYTHFSAEGEEFVFHASPFNAYSNTTDLQFQKDKICNWAPSDGCKSNIERLNFTVRRANYNLFRFFRDLFDYNNSAVNVIAKNVIEFLRGIMTIYRDINSEDCQQFVSDQPKLTILNNIYNNISELLNIYESMATMIDKKKKENIKNVAFMLYHLFKTKEKKLMTSENSILMLDNYLGVLYEHINDEKKMKDVLEKYTPELQKAEDAASRELYRTQNGGNYKEKYLKYKQKYLELKKSIN